MDTSGHYLDGRMLVAMPSMGDSRFERSVIYLCAHSKEGAMGIIVNHVASSITFRELLEQLDILPVGDQIRLPADFVNRKVFIGGPVETGRGFVLHSPDYFAESSTLPIANDVCLTSTIDILRAMVDGRGPRRSLFALGYAGWAPGQLETEIRDNGWLMCDASPELVFDTPNEAKYEIAMRSMGIDPAMLSPSAGEA
ncbi:MAG: YqgE/AlgH family protein [Flavobacteriaceae bacterium]